MASQSVRFSVRSRKLSNVGQLLDGWPKICKLKFLRASEATLSRWSRLHLQSLAPTNPHWARMVGYGPDREAIEILLWLINMNKYHSHFISKGVAETSQIFHRSAHVLPKRLNYEEYCIRDADNPIAIWSHSISCISALITFYDILGRKGEVLFTRLLFTYS
jgi:hypothetical protein